MQFARDRRARRTLDQMGVAMVVVGATTVFLLWLSVINSAAICDVECGLMLFHPSMQAMRQQRWHRA